MGFGGLSYCLGIFPFADYQPYAVLSVRLIALLLFSVFSIFGYMLGVCVAIILLAATTVCFYWKRHSTSTGRTSEVRQRWQRAIRKVQYWIRLRKRWAHLGQYLQQPVVGDTFTGVKRRNGKLIRTAAAPLHNAFHGGNTRRFSAFVSEHWRSFTGPGGR